MKKKCLSCGAKFALSGSGKRQKYCPKCARRGDGRGRGSPASKPLKTNGGVKRNRPLDATSDPSTRYSFLDASKQ